MELNFINLQCIASAMFASLAGRQSLFLSLVLSSKFSKFSQVSFFSQVLM